MVRRVKSNPFANKFSRITFVKFAMPYCYRIPIIWTYMCPKSYVLAACTTFFRRTIRLKWIKSSIFSSQCPHILPRCYTIATKLISAGATTPNRKVINLNAPRWWRWPWCESKVYNVDRKLFVWFISVESSEFADKRVFNRWKTVGTQPSARANDRETFG